MRHHCRHHSLEEKKENLQLSRVRLQCDVIDSVEDPRRTDIILIMHAGFRRLLDKHNKQFYVAT